MIQPLFPSAIGIQPHHAKFLITKTRKGTVRRDRRAGTSPCLRKQGGASQVRVRVTELVEPVLVL